MKRVHKIMKFILDFFLYFTVFCCAAYGNEYPRRIISLGPVITEQLYLLGVQDRIVGVTTYCLRPPEAAKKEKVGNVLEINTEKILSLKPDLVITTSLTGIKGKNSLKRAGLHIADFTYPKNFADICSQFRELGLLSGKSSVADNILKRSKSRVKVVSIKSSKLKKIKVFIQIGAKPLWTVPRDNFLNDLIELAGGINIAKDTGTGSYSAEQVIKGNPDVIIISDMGLIQETEKKNWQMFPVINAVKNNEIYFMDSYKLCSPNPVTFAETLEDLYKLLHKSIRQDNMITPDKTGK